MRGHIRKRGKISWNIAIYLGRDVTGKDKYTYHTVRGTKRVAEKELTRTKRSRERMYGMLEETDFDQKELAQRLQQNQSEISDLESKLGLLEEKIAKVNAARESDSMLQKFLLSQFKSGMLLCLCSKNNIEDVDAVFEQNPNMILQQKHIVARKVNWNSKSKNLIRLAEELNLSLDSFIFIDDSPIEIADINHIAMAIDCKYSRASADSPEQVS